MLTCPYCKGKAMTYFEKASFGPPKTRDCAQCGRAVTVSWLDWVFTAGCLAAMTYALFVPFEEGLGVMAFSIVVYAVVHVLLLPLKGADG